MDNKEQDGGKTTIQVDQETRKRMKINAAKNDSTYDELLNEALDAMEGSKECGVNK